VAYISRGLAWKMKREYDKAVDDYGQAIKFESGNAAYKNALAWLLATCPEDSLRDGRRAQALAEAACELTQWKNPGNLDTYAAACAEAGDFDSAMKWQTKALELLPDKSSNYPVFQYRLDLYKAGKPYRDPSEENDR
jgi:serine/threonine-protein kinase